MRFRCGHHFEKPLTFIGIGNDQVIERNEMLIDANLSIGFVKIFAVKQFAKLFAVFGFKQLTRERLIFQSVGKKARCINGDRCAVAFRFGDRLIFQLRERGTVNQVGAFVGVDLADFRNRRVVGIQEGVRLFGEHPAEALHGKLPVAVADIASEEREKLDELGNERIGVGHDGDGRSRQCCTDRTMRKRNPPF